MRKPLATAAANTSQALYMREENRSLCQLGQYALWGIKGKEAVGWRLRKNEQGCDRGFAQQIAAVKFVLESLFQIGKLFEDIAGFLNAFLKTYGRIFIAVF